MADVVIIGGGISGCSLLYQLSRYEVDVVLVERENDVGVATTKANSAIVHAGYDPEPGTGMARYNVRGNEIIHTLCRELDIPFKNTGSLVLAFDEADCASVQALYERGLKNGVPGLCVLERDATLALEPNLSSEVRCALHAPSAGVVSPWELAFAQAEVAVRNGAQVMLDAEVNAIDREGEGFVVHTSRGDIPARFVVNAAGVEADHVSAMAEAPHFAMHPNRGQYFLLDTTQGGLVGHVVFQCPSATGKGVLVAPTVHGNLIVGPSSEDVTGCDTATTRQGLEEVRRVARRSVPGIDFRDNIRNFAGVRAVADVDDFIVGESATTPGFFNIAGIKSPGLTAAPAIAEDVVRMLGAAGLALTERRQPAPERHIQRFAHMSAAERAEAIRHNPLYGTIVCRCQTVTEGEIVDALHRPLPPRSLDAVKRRCNAGMGRCQGGFCGPRVQAIIARELGLELAQVPLDRAGMDIITGETKTAADKA